MAVKFTMPKMPMAPGKAVAPMMKYPPESPPLPSMKKKAKFKMAACKPDKS